MGGRLPVVLLSRVFVTDIFLYVMMWILQGLLMNMIIL